MEKSKKIIKEGVKTKRLQPSQQQQLIELVINWPKPGNGRSQPRLFPIFCPFFLFFFFLVFYYCFPASLSERLKTRAIDDRSKRQRAHIDELKNGKTQKKRKAQYRRAGEDQGIMVIRGGAAAAGIGRRTIDLGSCRCCVRWCSSRSGSQSSSPGVTRRSPTSSQGPKKKVK